MLYLLWEVRGQAYTFKASVAHLGGDPLASHAVGVTPGWTGETHALERYCHLAAQQLDQGRQPGGRAHKFCGQQAKQLAVGICWLRDQELLPGRT